MNWLGKVFVVVILIMSLVFMGLAMAVYATHKNWQQVSVDLKKKLTDAQSENAKQLTEHNRRVEDLERDKTIAEQQAAKLDAERVSLAERNTLIQAELDGLKQNQREHIAAVASTQKINEGLAADVTDLRTRIRKSIEDRDKLFKSALDATEELHKAAGEYNRTRELNEQLTKQNAGMTSVMKGKGIDPNTDPNSVVPTVEGVVSKIERKAGGQLVEITIGADDGLKAGNTLEVSRGASIWAELKSSRRRLIKRLAESTEVSNRDRFRREIVLRRGSSSKKESPEKVEKPVSDKKAAKAKAAEAKAAEKKAAKAKAAEEKAAKKKAGKAPKAPKAPRIKEPAVREIRGVLDRRPKTSIYSVMLGISAAALAIGCLVLVLEIWMYGAPWTFPWNIPINLK